MALRRPLGLVQISCIDATKHNLFSRNTADICGTWRELAVKEPDLMRLVLQASVAAMVNVQAAAVNAELKRRAVTRN